MEFFGWTVTSSSDSDSDEDPRVFELHPWLEKTRGDRKLAKLNQVTEVEEQPWYYGVVISSFIPLHCPC